MMLHKQNFYFQRLERSSMNKKKKIHIEEIFDLES